MIFGRRIFDRRFSRSSCQPAYRTRSPALREKTRPRRSVAPLLVATVVALVLVSACGERTGPAGNLLDPPAPAELTVAVTPDAATVAAGESRRLSADVRNQDGDVVTRAVTWSSSDESVATVDGQGLVEAVGDGSVDITATVEEASGEARVEVPVPDGTAGSAGATVSSAGHPVALEVPAGALSEETAITILPAAADSLPAGTGTAPLAGTAFDLAPDGLRFAAPAFLEIGYDPAALPSGADESLLAIHRLTAGAWTEMTGSQVDAGTGVVRAPIDGFSIYAVAAGVNDPPTVTITSPLHGSTFAAGEEVLFEAEASDPEDGPLTGSSLQWTSDMDGHLGVGTSFTQSTLSAGSHLITATATDGSHEELTGRDTVRIEVEASEAGLALYLRSPNPPGSAVYGAEAETTVDDEATVDAPDVHHRHRVPEGGLPQTPSFACRDGLAVPPGGSAAFLAESNSQDVSTARAAFDVAVAPDAGSATLHFEGFGDAGVPGAGQSGTHTSSGSGRTVLPVGSLVVALDGVAGRRYDLEVTWSLAATVEATGTPLPTWAAQAHLESSCLPGTVPTDWLFDHVSQSQDASLTDAAVVEGLAPGDYSLGLILHTLAGAQTVSGDPDRTWSGRVGLEGTVTIRVLGESAAP